MKSIIVLVALTAGAAADPKLTGNVLVWVDAPMYLDASATGPSVKLGTLDQGRDQDVGFVVPMHVIGTSGDFVEVEPTADVECAWWRLARPDGLTSLHLFVRRDDLAPVLVKPFTATFKDGSRIALEPGVAVLDGKVAFHDAVVPAAVPEASRGIAYAPHSVAAVPKRGAHTFLLDEKTEVTLGTQTFALGPWVANTAEPRGKRMLVHLAARCMTAVISAPKEHLHRDVALGHGPPGVSEEGRKLSVPTGDRYYLAQGTPLTSEKGDHVVATLGEERDIKKPTAGRGCTDFVVTREEPNLDAPRTRDTSPISRTLHLCAKADQVKVEHR
jgi:hypothetical protein